MKRLLILVGLLVALAGGSWSDGAFAAPCLIGNAGGCIHWADYDRSTPGTVGVHTNWQVNGAQWDAAVNGRAAYFNGVVGNVKAGGAGTPAPAGNAACTNIPYNAYAFKMTACAAGYNQGEYCGVYAPHQWSACAQSYLANDTLGNPTNHVVWVVIRLKDPGIRIDQFGNIVTFVLGPNDRGNLWCHEMLGHGFGMTHNGPNDNMPGPDDPATPQESCLYYMQGTNTVLGGVIPGQIQANHAHNDPTYDYAGIGIAPKRVTTSLKTASVVMLKSVKTEDGQPYYVVPKGYRAPAGYRTATALPPAAFAPKITLAKSFTPQAKQHEWATQTNWPCSGFNSGVPYGYQLWLVCAGGPYWWLVHRH